MTWSRVAIVNRGEPAVRFLTAAREYNRERGADLRTIALYTAPDRRAMFVRGADEAYDLGAPTYVDGAGRRISSYLDYRRLERALVEARAEAVWVGWGFVAEHAAFADLCEQLGLAFLGPSGDVMRALGDKITSKQLAERAGVPVAPWSGGAVESVDDARQSADVLGYPLVVKATAGGGGRGIRQVRSADELAGAFTSARDEARKAFGDDTVFLERLVTGARHVEVQVISDGRGTTWGLGVRDCTIQRRNQKVLEETPSPALSHEQSDQLCQSAVRLADLAGYRSAGTVEFLYEPRTGAVSFMEVNARLQVEHPITELTTGIDLVKLQIDIARGGRLPGEAPTQRGHAVELRINAEDPDAGFAPAPGRIERFHLGGGPGVRVDTGIEPGDAVAPEFDSMIAKVIGYGSTRDEALARVGRALAEGTLVVRGGASNKGFLLHLLQMPELHTGEIDVGWLDRLVVDGRHIPRAGAAAALVAAAIQAADAEADVERARFYAAAARGRPDATTAVSFAVELAYAGASYALEVDRLAPNHYSVRCGGVAIDAVVEDLGGDSRRLTCGGSVHRVSSIIDGIAHVVEVDGAPYRVTRDDAGAVRAPAPGVVVSIAVAEGDDVAAGDRLVVLEAMKTEISIRAEFSGRVKQIAVTPNVQVGPGAPLVFVEPAAVTTADAPSHALDLAALATAPADSTDLARCRRNLAELRSLMLGYDIGAEHLDVLVAERGALCDSVPCDAEDIREREHEILQIFADIAALFHHEPDTQDLTGGGRLSARQYLYDYLRDPSSRGADLPATFVSDLTVALSHYGIDSLDDSPRLRDALYRLFRSQQRVASQIPPILSVLERRLDEVDAQRGRAGDGFRRLLDRTISETEGRFALVNDLARTVRYEYFDRPVLDAALERFYSEADHHLHALGEHPPTDERRRRIRELVNCPQPLMRMLSRRMPDATNDMRAVMLEVMSRRYYRIRDIGPVRVHDGVATFEYDWKGTRIHVSAAHTPVADMSATLRAIAPTVARGPAHNGSAIDLYVQWFGPLPEPDETEARMRAEIEAAGIPDGMRRIVVALAGDRSGASMRGVQHFTYRPRLDGGYAEQKLYRGLHPMMGKRLDLWRLSEFETERLPSADDVYLFRAAARDNKDDVRLFAIAEVRDLTPVRNRAGKVVGLPHLTHMLLEAVAGIRRFHYEHPEHRRLQWNRIQLHVWPPLTLDPDELNSLVHKQAPVTAGIGLEKVVLRAQLRDPQTGDLRDTLLHISNPGGAGLVVQFREPANRPIAPLSKYKQKVARLRQWGLTYPYELIRMIAPSAEGIQTQFPAGRFVEHDLDDDDALVPVDRALGENTTNIVVGVIENYTTLYPEGLKRVALLGDPSRGMGALAEPECRRIIAALELARERRLPVEWYAISAGAKIAMDSGTENMDWIALVLRRLIEFTQAGGEVNIVVAGINVGAQPYWNAEATMLMHTRGVLIMTPQSAMVLTGKRALDYSGGVSAEDNFGIGGYERIMGPNGQAHYFARDLTGACQVLMRHYDHTYVAPGERFPRQAATNDPRDRDVCRFPHGHGDGYAFDTVGDVFSSERNPGRKTPFDIRRVMLSAIDQDHEPLERWYAMRAAESAVVWDAHLGGHAVCLLGLESRPSPRLGFVPADGPKRWTAGTLFPLSSKKVARAINAASDNRPVVVLANLSGFDGSPDSMRSLQLEYGAEIGRAVVNFRGPIVFCVVSRYHGGAFVVFSGQLNDGMEIAALEGTYASVIGGAPAAAVVFARDVKQRTHNDPRVAQLQAELGTSTGADRVKLQTRFDALLEQVHSEKLGEVASEFDDIHSVYRARDVGSVNRIIAPSELRPYLIDAVERGMAREVGKS